MMILMMMTQGNYHYHYIRDPHNHCDPLNHHDNQNICDNEDHHDYHADIDGDQAIIMIIKTKQI